MSEDNNQNEEEKELDGSEGEGESSGFKSKGILILGLIVFIAALFAVQEYVHFDSMFKDKKKVKHVHKNMPSAAVPLPGAHSDASHKEAKEHIDLHKKDIPHTHEVDSHQGLPTPVESVKAVTDKDDQHIKEVVGKYIEENPEVVAKALQSLTEKMSKERDNNSKSFIKNNMQKIVSGRPWLGNPHGSVVIVEFFDYKCTYCKKSNVVLEKILKDYPQAKLVLQPVPVLGKNSESAVKAALAVWKISPKHFEHFHEDLINSPTIDEHSILAVARKNGISTDALTKEMESEEVKKIVNDNLSNARSIGMKGVPTFIVKGELVPGSLSYEGFKEILGKSNSQDKTGHDSH